MPCISEYPGEREAGLREELDRLTHENDELREALLTLKDGGELRPAMWMKIGREQIKHRKEDLARLDRTLREALRKAKPGVTNVTLLYERLGRVVAADPSKPLEPQLGFDPDSL